MSTKKKVGSLEQIPAVNAYLQRISAEPRSMRSAVIREIRGSYWKDLGVVRLARDGTVTAPDAYAPTENEQTEITKACAEVEFPRLQKLANVFGTELPDAYKNAESRDIFEFRDSENRIVMLQIRVSFADGTKNYHPFTFWDDGEWRRMEPDGYLPLFNLHKLKDASTVFIHEGAKAARHCQEMIDARTPEAKASLASHPWGRELSGAVHLGWIGGALSPSRTDWSEIKRSGVKRAYIVSDNDIAGLSAVPAISFHLDLPTFHLQFTSEWPTSFDLADEFPKKMFAEFFDEKRYVGPTFADCLHPATWATDMIPVPKSKPVAVLRESCKQMWAYVESADIFVCTEMPQILRTEAVLNKQLAAFSHVSETSRLIVRAFTGRSVGLCYRPDVKGRIVTDRGSSSINLHVAPDIRGIDGNPKPWLDFLQYLFPNAKEKETAAKWCATLIARPETRMHFGMLLVTEKQGIGKTTLGSKVLAPLVGISNVGWPSESDVATSQFNGWLAHKRLLVVNEIYSGHSWKAYNNLKSMITDTEVEVNQKYQRTYTVDNWAHIIACSNSLRALRMEDDDRRWFYPSMTEVPWSKKQFTDFYAWLAAGGLGIIKRWAETLGTYIETGDRAPMTERKKELIAGSRSEGAAEAASLGEALASFPEPAVLALHDVFMNIRSSVQGKLYETENDLRKAMVEVGCHTWHERLKIHSRLQNVVMNPAAWRAIEEDAGNDEHDPNKMIRKFLVSPDKIMEREI